MLNEGNQLHNFISTYGSYGSGSATLYLRVLPILEGCADDVCPRVPGFPDLQNGIRGNQRFPLHQVHAESVQVLVVLVDRVALELAEDFAQVLGSAFLLIFGPDSRGHVEEERQEQQRKGNKQHGG
jgi:hypothetical protein